MDGWMDKWREEGWTREGRRHLRDSHEVIGAQCSAEPASAGQSRQCQQRAAHTQSIKLIKIFGNVSINMMK